MAFSFGDIYLVAFDPSTGHEYRDERPALVIQEESISEKSPYITVVPLTSKLHRKGEANIFIEKDAKNRLSSDSIIVVRHISSFDRSRFKYLIGKAGSPVVRQVRGYLRRHFGL